jgi:hypothetical protein
MDTGSSHYRWLIHEAARDPRNVYRRALKHRPCLVQEARRIPWGRIAGRKRFERTRFNDIDRLRSAWDSAPEARKRPRGRNHAREPESTLQSSCLRYTPSFESARGTVEKPWSIRKRSTSLRPGEFLFDSIVPRVHARLRRRSAAGPAGHTRSRNVSAVTIEHFRTCFLSVSFDTAGNLLLPRRKQLIRRNYVLINSQSQPCYIPR